MSVGKYVVPVIALIQPEIRGGYELERVADDVVLFADEYATALVVEEFEFGLRIDAMHGEIDVRGDPLIKGRR